jgi:hypothetical protein
MTAKNVTDCLNRFLLRDFVYSDENLHKQEEELSNADNTEKELWVSSISLLRYEILTEILLLD